MTHDPLCPCAPIDPIRPGAVYTTNSASCQCILINLAYEQGWEAGYKQCDDEWMGKENYN